MNAVKKAVVCLYIILSILTFGNAALAADVDDVIKDNINSIDFNQWEEFIKELRERGNGFADDFTVEGLIRQIASGKLDLSFNTIAGNIWSLLLQAFYKLLPLVMDITVLAIFTSIIMNIRKDANGHISELVKLILYALVLIILFKGCYTLISYTKTTVSRISEFIQIATPVLLTLLITVGASNTAATISPEATILTSGVGLTIINIFIPIIIVTIILIFISNLSDRVKLQNLSALFKSISNWGMGILFTVFAGIITVQGLAASSFDGVSLRALKYTMNNGIPIIGGMMGESMNLVLSCTMLVKNAVGIVSIIVILIIIIMPLLNILAYIFMLKACAAIISPIAETNVVSLLNQLSEGMKMLLMAICGIATVAIIFLGLVIGAGNSIF